MFIFIPPPTCNVRSAPVPLPTMGPKPQSPRRFKQDGASSQRPVPRRGSCVGRLTRCSALGSVAAALLAYFAGALLPTPPKPTDPDVAVLDTRFEAAIAAASGLSVSTKGQCVVCRL